MSGFNSNGRQSILGSYCGRAASASSKRRLPREPQGQTVAEKMSTRVLAVITRLYRPLMARGMNEYHPSMPQSLKSKYLLLALGIGAGLSLLLGAVAYYEHRIDTADISRLTYATVEQKLQSDLEVRAN